MPLLLMFNHLCFLLLVLSKFSLLNYYYDSTTRYDFEADTILISLALEEEEGGATSTSQRALLRPCKATVDAQSGVVSIPLVRRRQTTTEYFASRAAREAAAAKLLLRPTTKSTTTTTKKKGGGGDSGINIINFQDSECVRAPTVCRFY